MISGGRSYGTRAREWISNWRIRPRTCCRAGKESRRGAQEMPHIVHISNIHRADDARIFARQCVSASSAGFQVTLLGRVERPDCRAGVQRRPIPTHVPVSRSPIAYRRIHQTILREADELAADLYQFHDVELIDVALALIRRGRTVVFDAHEDHPRQVRAMGSGKGILGQIKPLWVHRRIRAMDHQAAGIIAATQTILNTYDNPSRVLVRNFPRVSLFQSREKRRHQIVYVGGLSRARGADVMVQAMAYLQHPDATLHIMGAELEPGLVGELKALPGAARVKWYPHSTYQEAITLLESSGLGLFVAAPMRHLRDSLPVKIYEYMAASMPMIVSDFPEWREQFAASGAVEFVPPQDPIALAKRMDQLLLDPDGLEVRGRLGRKWVEQHCSWERESERLIGFYRQLLESRRK
ncbi:MAG: glycosyltransferase [Candidatus Dadabacteria bacterium]|nr:MAG: glycosyltransferase [Candidatus Dadabacteria bacterium]